VGLSGSKATASKGGKYGEGLRTNKHGNKSGEKEVEKYSLMGGFVKTAVVRLNMGNIENESGWGKESCK